MNSQNYNTQIWADMDSDERNTYYIAEAYLVFCKSRGDNRKHLPLVTSKISQRDQYLIDEGEAYPADKIRNHKNWQYFQRVWEKFKYDQAFDPVMYIESVARKLPKDKFIFPAQLATKKNMESYIEYRRSQKIGSKVDDTKRIMTGVTQTYKLISRKMGVTKLSKDDLYNFFNTPKDNNILSEGFLWCMQEMISPYYFSVSKSFIHAYKNTDPDIQEELLPKDRLKDMAVLVRSKTRVYDFVKKIFGEDII